MWLFEYLESFPWAVGAIFMVLIFVIFTITGVLVVRQIVNIKTLKSHHDVAGFVFANLGVLYAVLLGFTVVNVQQRFDKVQEIAQLEAAYLEELYQDADVFPAQNTTEIRSSVKRYGESVILDEWPLMAQGRTNKKTDEALKHIFNAYYKIEPKTTKEQAWYAESISKLNQLMSERLSRLIYGQGSLGSEMWSLLIIGGLGMVTFMWFFGMDSLTTHLLMSSILAATTAFMLFLIYSLDTAFTGSVSVSPEALESVLNSQQFP